MGSPEGTIGGFGPLSQDRGLLGIGLQDQGPNLITARRECKINKGDEYSVFVMFCKYLVRYCSVTV